MQSILTCRMLFELRQYGKRTVYGEDYSEFASEYMAAADPLVFQQGAAAIPVDSTDITRASHKGPESDVSNEGVQPQNLQSTVTID